MIAAVAEHTRIARRLPHHDPFRGGAITGNRIG
jgi:hypothetical protein